VVDEPLVRISRPPALLIFVLRRGGLSGLLLCGSHRCGPLLRILILIPDGLETLGLGSQLCGGDGVLDDQVSVPFQRSSEQLEVQDRVALGIYEHLDRIHLDRVVARVYGRGRKGKAENRIGPYLGNREPRDGRWGWVDRRSRITTVTTGDGDQTQRHGSTDDERTFGQCSGRFHRMYFDRSSSATRSFNAART
jgi:hypothetical protein